MDEKVKQKGWICLHRKIQDCFIWDSNEKFDSRSAWIDLLLLANHENKNTMFDGKPIVVKKGQRITSVRILSDRWHWSNEKTLKYLRMLEQEKMIVRESDNRRTLLTIVNYELYQDIANTEQNTEQNTDRTLTERQSATNNNENNENNNKKHTSEKNELAEQLFEVLWKQYPKKEGKGQVSVAKKIKLLGIGEEQMLRCIDRYKMAKANTEMRYLMNGSTFFNSGYVDYLEENVVEQKPVSEPKAKEPTAEEPELTDDEYFDKLFEELDKQEQANGNI